MQIPGVSSSESFLAPLQGRKKKSNNPCATPYVYPSLPCTNTSCQRHLTPITLRCVLTPSTAITSQWETRWMCYSATLSSCFTLCWRRRGGAGAVIKCWMHTFHCSTLKQLKAVFTFHYCMWYCPVLIDMLDTHSLCLYVFDSEDQWNKNKTKEFGFLGKHCPSLKEHKALLSTILWF